MREAEIAVDDDAFAAMGIEGLVALTEAAGLRDLEELECRGTGAVVAATVAERLDEAGLDALAVVDEWEYVGAHGDGHRYVVAFTAPELPAEMDALSEELIGTCDPEVRDGGATVSLTGEQSTIAEAVGAYEDAGVSTDLRSLGAYDGEVGPLAALTDRQREVLATAHEMGYYDVPRTASTDEVAAELGVDDSTVAEHLQRAERNLLDELF
jgi:predicted DNA binding protein